MARSWALLCATALLLASARAEDRAIDEPEEDDEFAAEPEPDLAHAEQLAQFKQVTAAATKAAQGEPKLIPTAAEEWYTVTIADVSVGFMYTATVLHPEDLHLADAGECARARHGRPFQDKELTAPRDENRALQSAVRALQSCHRRGLPAAVVTRRGSFL